MQKVARIYLRVSTQEQELARQEQIAQDAKAQGFYIAGTYRDKASGASAERPELLRMISDLQEGEIIIAERIDRISRLPLPEAERLIAQIRAKGARLAVPGITDLSELASSSEGVAKIVLTAVQDMLLKIALQTARDDYELRRTRQRQGIEIAKKQSKYTGKPADTARNLNIVKLRSSGISINATASAVGCSVAHVKRIWAMHKKNQSQ